jgi:hypothetical protein
VKAQLPFSLIRRRLSCILDSALYQRFSMPIDDLEFDAVRKRFELEDTAISPVTKAVLDLASLMPLAWPFDKAAGRISGHLAADSLARIRLLLEAVMNEVRKHEVEIQRLRDSKTAAEMEAREELSRELLLEAARRAEGTRGKERVRRIALILANAVVEPRTMDADEAEEMMRVASELSDLDIEYLRELIRIEGALLESADHIPRYDAYVKWEQGFWGDRINPEIDSLFSKLESYGLVARLAPPNNLNVLADFQNRYVLLKKGMRFASMISEAAGRN